MTKKTTPPGRRFSLKTACMVISTAAAVAIPVVVLIASSNIQENYRKIARATLTIQIMDDLDRRISNILDEKRILDDKNGKEKVEEWSKFDYIDDNKDVESQVIKLLNGYDFICTGGNEKLFSNSIIEKIRGTTLKKTWQDYMPYISDYRVKYARPDAWTACKEWIDRNLTD